MGKKEKKKSKSQKHTNFFQKVGKEIHKKGSEIVWGLVIGIITNYMTDASEKVMEHFVKKQKNTQKKKA